MTPNIKLAVSKIGVIQFSKTACGITIDPNKTVNCVAALENQLDIEDIATTTPSRFRICI